MLFGREMNDRQMIKALESRLRWFMNEANQDEFDDEEVIAIVDLLQVMDPVEKKEGDFYTADKACERFWTFYAFRERPEEDELPYPLSMRIEMRLRQFFRSSAFAKASLAVVLVLAVFLGGTVGAYAQRNGFFQWVKNNDEKGVSITSPDSVSSEMDAFGMYKSLEEVPLKYTQYLWIPRSLPEEFDLVDINITYNKSFVYAQCKYSTGEQFIGTIKKQYRSVVNLNDVFFEGFEYLETESVDGIEVSYYRKESDDYTEYIAYFCIDNTCYLLGTNVDIQQVKEIICNEI